VSGSRPTAKRAVAAKVGDVLLAARGGQAVIAGDAAGAGLEGAYPTLDVYLIRPEQDQLDPVFLAAWLTFEPVRNSLQASTTGSLIPRIPIGSLKDLAIPLPHLQRQRQIGALFQLAHQEAALMERLVTHVAQLRTRQLAAAFAALES
jgi:restriction endonuclease S subunit